MNSEKSFTGFDPLGIRAWGARIEVFECRVYPIIAYDDVALKQRRKILENIKSINFKDVDKLKDAYMKLFRFLNLQLLKVDVYNAPDLTIEEDIPEWYYNKPKLKGKSEASSDSEQDDEPTVGVQLLQETNESDARD